MLRWVLDPSETHGLGIVPLKKFLQAISLAKIKYRGNKDSFLPNEMLEAFVTESCRIGDATVRLEQSTGNKDTKGRRGRADLVAEVEMKIGNDEKTLPIVLENKVDTDEHSEQTVTYRDWAQKTYGDKAKFFEPVYIFLTPDSDSEMLEAENNGCSCKSYVHLNYQLLSELVFGPCLDLVRDDSVRNLLSDYIRCLGCADISIDDEENSNENNHAKKRTIMAIDSNQKELLRRFWEKNRPLLSAALDALADDEELSDEDRKTLRKVSVISQGAKERRFRLDGEEVVATKAAFVRKVVEAWIRKYPESSFKNLENAFPPTCGVNQKNGAVVQEEGSPLLTNPKLKGQFTRTPLSSKLSGKEIYVWKNQWTDRPFNNFLEQARKIFNIECLDS